ncbi:MAG: ABC transporter ATP-binding protein [Vicinamibacteria bacterium]
MADGLVATDLRKEYAGPTGPLAILDGVSLALAPGESLCVMGPSGSGKSTLLAILGALESPTSGTVALAGEDPARLSEKDLAGFRNRRVGFVFQDHCLLPQLTALENVLVPSLVAPPDAARTARARELLEAVGLGSRLDHRPAQLSGGEKQRVAIARALVMQPALVLCDEPTGNLDARAADAVGTLLTDLHRRLRSVLVVVTHSAELASRFADRRQLRAGRLVAAA